MKFNHYMIILCAVLILSISMFLIVDDSILMLMALFK